MGNWAVSGKHRGEDARAAECVEEVGGFGVLGDRCEGAIGNFGFKGMGKDLAVFVGNRFRCGVGREAPDALEATTSAHEQESLVPRLRRCVG